MNHSATFLPDHAVSAFADFAEGDPTRLPIGEAFTAMFDFYASIAAEGALPEDEEGDMLLFEYGTYNWGEGERFELCLTRQLVLEPDEDELEYWQLRLVFRYDPDRLSDATESGLRWCSNARQLPQFRQFVFDSPAYRSVAGLSPSKVDLEWEQQ